MNPHRIALATRAVQSAAALVPLERGTLVVPDTFDDILLSVVNDLQMFGVERVVSIDTTASGGNATLLTLSEE